MEIALTILGIIVVVLLVLAFSFLGAIIMYLTEDETYESDKRNDEVHTNEMDKR